MIRLLLIAPYRGITAIAREALRVRPRPGLDLKIVEAAGVHVLEQISFDTDAVISRGVTATALRRLLPRHLPLVELKVTAYDVLRAMAWCREHHRGREVAVIGSRNMIEGAESVAGIVGLTLRCTLISGEEDAEACLDEALASEAGVVMGGALVCSLATARGIPCRLIESGRESVLAALDEAAQVAQVALDERLAAERMRTILDVMEEGVLALDAAGCVNMWNAAAARILASGTPLAVGAPVGSVLPQLDARPVLRDGERVVGAVHVGSGIEIVANVVPLVVGRHVLGGVATLQEVGRVQEAEQTIRAARRRAGHAARYTFADVTGDSPPLRQAVAQARQFARSNASVLICGETGTGKELFAQSLHNASPRRDGPFVAVNCAALAETLLESELFGYVAGAFTGALRSGKIGLFEAAHRGTIFLDEISELPPRLQGKLLRVLQEREVMRLGDDRVIPIDVRVLSATNRDLATLAAAGEFRLDLLYRLNVLQVSIPPLRERREDVRILAERFLAAHGEARSGQPIRLAVPAVELLAGQTWPGNVRELRNVCERLSVLTRGEEVTAEQARQGLGLSASSPSRPAPVPEAPGETLEEHRCRAVREALAACAGNRIAAARKLGISRSTLWRLLRRMRA